MGDSSEATSEKITLKREVTFGAGSSHIFVRSPSGSGSPNTPCFGFFTDFTKNEEMLTFGCNLSPTKDQEGFLRVPSSQEAAGMNPKMMNKMTSIESCEVASDSNGSMTLINNLMEFNSRKIGKNCSLNFDQAKKEENSHREDSRK